MAETETVEKITILEDVVLTTAQLREMGVAVVNGKVDPKSKVPGLEITWEVVQALEIDPYHGVKALLQLKAELPRAKLVLIPSNGVSYVFRTCSAQEWSLFVRSRGDMNKRRDDAIAAGEPAHAVEQKLKDMWMEAVLSHFVVLPKLTVDQIREGLMPGELISMFETYSNELGFNQQLPAIRL